MAFIWCETMEMIKTRPLPLIRDSEFKNGFAIYGPTHEDGMTAQYAGVSKTTGVQAWNIAQWANYNHPLDAKTTRTNLENGGFIYETPTCKLSVHDSHDYLIRLELRTDAEYKGRIRKNGEEWPHLLLEQNDVIDYYPPMGEWKKLSYRISIMPEYLKCNAGEEDMDPSLHAAQLVHYLAVWDPVAQDGFWFGLTFWDNRHEVFPGYMSEDVGKDDCTHKMIVVDPILEYTDKAPSLGQWTDIECDLLPRIRKGVENAKARGYLRDAQFERMKIVSTNIGLEIPGSYNMAFRIRALSLLGE